MEQEAKSYLGNRKKFMNVGEWGGGNRSLNISQLIFMLFLSIETKLKECLCNMEV
jgi:hypothetical protein